MPITTPEYIAIGSIAVLGITLMGTGPTWIRGYGAGLLVLVTAYAGLRAVRML